jgi:phosphoglycolate phosphatase
MGKQELLHQALTEESLHAEACWMVGDRLFDMEGARACGMRNIGVLYGYGSRDELVQAGAEALAKHPEEIPPLIKKAENAA